MTPAPFYFILMETQNIPTKRILVLADFACNTGFGTVAQNIVSQLLLEERVDYYVDIVGINYHGEPNSWQRFYPKVRLFSAKMSSGGDLWGRSFLMDLLCTGDYDYLWVLQDTFIVRTFAAEAEEIHKLLEGKKQFKFIYYFPLDATPPPEWITEGVAKAHVPVSYTEWAKGLCCDVDTTLQDRIEVIPHGVDTKIFHPTDAEEAKEWRSKYFHGHADGKTLVVNVNRNQPRKDIGRTLQVIRKVVDDGRIGDFLFYLHMQPKDLGLDVVSAAKSLGLEMYKHYVIPNKEYSANKFPATMLNRVYNAADIVMSTALGEGWGLSLTESMATKTPVIAPNHTAVADVCGYGKYATLCKADNPIIIANDNEVIRRQTNIADMAQCIYNVAENPPQMTEDAYNYVTTQLDWNVVGQMWRDLFYKHGA